jgi:hypothetical protein
LNNFLSGRKQQETLEIRGQSRWKDGSQAGKSLLFLLLEKQL